MGTPGKIACNSPVPTPHCIEIEKIGEHCGGMDYAAVSQAQHRMENKLRQERSLAAALKRIAKRLANVEC
jgi:hypothetical protein